MDALKRAQDWIAKAKASGEKRRRERRFPETLKDENHIENYLQNLSSYPINKKKLHVILHNTYAVLKTVPIDSIKEGPRKKNRRHPWKEVKYMHMPVDTMPPVMVWKGTVIDGNHRLRVMKKKGEKTIRAYFARRRS